MKPKSNETDIVDIMIAEVRRRRMQDVPEGIHVMAAMVFDERVQKDEIDELSLEALAFAGFKAMQDGVTIFEDEEGEEVTAVGCLAQDVAKRIGDTPPERLNHLAPGEFMALALVGFMAAVVTFAGGFHEAYSRRN
jgi:hypothetical protein